jgi:hypothetical protein
MPNAIMDLLTSAKILADVNKDSMLSYLIDMAMQESRDAKKAYAKAKKAA